MVVNPSSLATINTVHFFCGVLTYVRASVEKSRTDLPRSPPRAHMGSMTLGSGLSSFCRSASPAKRKSLKVQKGEGHVLDGIASQSSILAAGVQGKNTFRPKKKGCGRVTPRTGGGK